MTRPNFFFKSDTCVTVDSLDSRSEGSRGEGGVAENKRIRPAIIVPLPAGVAAAAARALSFLSGRDTLLYWLAT